MHNETVMDLYGDLMWIDYWTSALAVDLVSDESGVATIDDTKVESLCPRSGCPGTGQGAL